MAIGQTTITRGTSICCHVWLFIIAWAYTPIDRETFLCFFTALTSAYVNALHRVGVQYIFVCYQLLCQSAGKFTNGVELLCLDI